jgi:hypothetical protein
MTPDSFVVTTKRNRVFRSACCMAMAFFAPCVHAEDRPPAVAARPADAAGQTFTIPGTSYQIVAGASQLAPDSSVPVQELVGAIATWLAAELDFPPPGALPRIEFASSEQLSTLRHAGITSEATYDPGNTVAVYNDRDKTIYLPQGWTGRTAAELSVLVHEMVHHAQHAAAQKFACNEAREEVAYQAQQRWLAMFGRDLFQEFEMDAFTLLVRTNCGL